MKKENKPIGNELETGKEGPVNFRSEEWREEQREACRRAAENIIKAISKKIGEDFVIDIKESYDPDIEGAYLLSINIQSSKIDDLRIIWMPLRHEVENWVIYIKPKHEGQGISTALEEAVEKIARELGAHTLIFNAITENSLGYWRNRPGVVLDEEMHRATKKLREN